jgi:hypothetical protein
MANNLVLMGQLEDRGITIAKQPNDSMFLAWKDRPIVIVHRLRRLYALGAYIEAKGLPAALSTVPAAIHMALAVPTAPAAMPTAPAVLAEPEEAQGPKKKLQEL